MDGYSVYPLLGIISARLFYTTAANGKNAPLLEPAVVLVVPSWLIFTTTTRTEHERNNYVDRWWWTFATSPLFVHELAKGRCDFAAVEIAQTLQVLPAASQRNSTDAN